MDAYVYIKDSLSSESLIVKLFYAKLNDIRYVRNYIRDQVIIDAGCGAGSLSLLLGLLGAKHVYAVDFLPDCIELTKDIIEIAGLKNVTVMQCDIAELDLPEKSVDGILSIEAISHYRNPDAFLGKASSLIKTGGFLVISDGNNAASRKIKKMTFEIWDVFENYPKATTIFGHSKSEKCYLDNRKEIIRKNFADLNQLEIEKYAQYTFAYPRQKIIDVVQQFINGDYTKKSEYFYGKCPLDPETNCYMEQLFNPKDLKNKLIRYGFKSKIKSKGPTKKGFMVLSLLWELLSPITINFPRPFQIISKKEDR